MPAAVETTPTFTPAEQSAAVGKGEKKAKGRPAKKGTAKAKASPKSKTKKATPKAKAKAKAAAASKKVTPKSKAKSKANKKQHTDVSDSDDEAPPRKVGKTTGKKVAEHEKDEEAPEVAAAETSSMVEGTGSTSTEGSKRRTKHNKQAPPAKHSKLGKLNKFKKAMKAKKVPANAPSPSASSSDPEVKGPNSSKKSNTSNDKKEEQKKRNARKSCAYRQAQKKAQDEGLSKEECAAAGRKVFWPT